MKQILTILLTLTMLSDTIVYAFDLNTYTSPEFYRHYGKQQIKTKDSKGNTIYITPSYSSYEDRNNVASEKYVAIYDKRSPAYGYRYVLYTPIGHYVGHHRLVQPSPNGYGYAPIPDGDETGVTSQTPCFKTIQEAKHYYYPQWY
jgi:hypothetical protein